MARPSRLTISKSDIFSYFDKASPTVYSAGQLSQILDEQRPFWRLAQRTSTTEFIRFLIDQGKLKRQEFRSHEYGQGVERYSWGDGSIYQLALSLRKDAYLSHGTAVFLHGLNDIIPTKLYLNAEQSPKPPPRGGLTQAALNRAFANKQRQSNFSYKHGDWTITVINGKNTGRLGVEQLSGPSSEAVSVTNLERTLIDIVVRPAYAGGVYQVLEAYKSAKENLSTNRLISILRKLNYVYPYHQAIGFLMERAGYDSSRFSMLRDLGIEFDFYLSHGLENPSYDKAWKLFIPQSFVKA